MLESLRASNLHLPSDTRQRATMRAFIANLYLLRIPQCGRAPCQCHRDMVAAGYTREAHRRLMRCRKTRVVFEHAQADRQLRRDKHGDGAS